MLLLLLLGLPAAPGMATTSMSVLQLDVSADPPVLVIPRGLLPGGRVLASVRVSNEGHVPFRYAVTTTTSDDGSGLTSVLIAELAVTTSGCADLSAVALRQAPLAELVIGDPQRGEQPGDRTLPTGESETICIRVTLPRTAGDRYQDATTSAEFTIVAEAIDPPA